MSSRRWLFAVVGLSAILHVVGMARTPLPAQDGLKFLRVARQFQTQPWGDVVRSSDQHPLYPALVAAAEPAVARFVPEGPDSWRLAAQGVSALAALALLWPLHRMTARLFDERTANLAALLYALLPFPAAIGHDTLSDSLALSLTVAALCLGEATLRTNSWASAIGCGLAAGLGFLTRPEAALVPPVVALAAVWRRRDWSGELAVLGRLAAMAATLLACVGGYATVKGELSEKLSTRWSTQIGVEARAARKPPAVLPKGLDDPRFDFSPKEESDQPSLVGRPIAATLQLAREWGEGGDVSLPAGPDLGHRPLPDAPGLVRRPAADRRLPGRVLADRDPPRGDPGIPLGPACPQPGGGDDPVRLGGVLGLGLGVPGPSGAGGTPRPSAGLCRAGGPGGGRDRGAGEGGSPQPLGLSRRRALARGQGGPGRRGARHEGLGVVRPGNPGIRLLARSSQASGRYRNLKYVVVGDRRIEGQEPTSGHPSRGPGLRRPKPVAEFSRPQGRAGDPGVEGLRGSTPPDSWEGVHALTSGHGNALRRAWSGARAGRGEPSDIARDAPGSTSTPQ